MKLQLLHGPGIISSRAKLQSIKKSFNPNSIMVFGAESTIEQIMGSLLTPSLFLEDRLIVLENPPEELNLALSLITYPLSLIFWFDHEISLKNPLFKFIKNNDGQILFFEEAKEVSIFPFLDYLAAKDYKAFIELQKLKKGGFDVFYILTMVFYLLRNLVATPKNTPEFVKKKLTKQRQNFTSSYLEKLYRNILEIEFKLKKGLLDESQAEFLLVNLFMV